MAHAATRVETATTTQEGRANADPPPAVASVVRSRRSWGPGAYALGAPISLADLLALPPDGQSYDRDERGRLIVTPPDDAAEHRTPIAESGRRLDRALDEANYLVVQEAPISFEDVYSLAGGSLPESHHGPKALVADIACFRRPVALVTAPTGHTWYACPGLLLAIEFLSPSTWRSDLGDGDSPEAVDRWRTYLEAPVPELWLVNARAEALGLPPRSGLFLSYDAMRRTWSDLLVEDARYAPADYRGRRPVTSGRVRSLALPGVVFDLARLWRDCGFSV